MNPDPLNPTPSPAPEPASAPVAPAAPAAAAVPSTPEFFVIGVGHSGGAIAERLAITGMTGAEVLAVDTDTTSLRLLPGVKTAAFGAKAARGGGCGNDLALGATAAKEDNKLWKQRFAGVRLVCVITGVGGGVGGGSGPVIARIARETGALVLSVAILPFDYEGSLRRSNAAAGLDALRAAADAVICVPNQGVAAMLDDKTPLMEMFTAANDLVAQSVSSIWRLLHRPALNPVSFADLERLLRGRHAASVFAAVEVKGAGRAREALERLQKHPFLQAGDMLVEADAALVAVAGGNDLRFDEVQGIQNQFQRLCEHAQLMTGAAVDPALEGRLVVTVIATKGGASTLANAAASHATGAAPTSEPAASNVAAASEPAERLEFEMPGSRSGAETGSGGRVGEMFVPPARNLSDGQKRELAQRQIKNPLKRKKAIQTLFKFDVVSVNRFSQTEPVKRNGENLDEPTYARRGIALN
jgi:cell division protein FtsZ